MGSHANVIKSYIYDSITTDNVQMAGTPKQVSQKYGSCVLQIVSW